MRNKGWLRAVVVSLGVLAFAAVGVVSQVIINEIAWTGTAASANDEWIELTNISDLTVDLTGWTLRIDGSVIHLGDVADATVEVRRSTIEAGGYLLLERTDDTTVSDIEADIIYKGGLSNGGEDVFLVDAEGTTVDQILAAESGWPAGTTGDDEDFPYASMERFHPPYMDVAWGVNSPMIAMNGQDADGNALYGTPLAENSSVGYAASVPRVEILGPAPGVVEGTAIIQWVAADPDGDDSALAIMIVVTHLESQHTVTIGENVANTGSFAWDTMGFENGEYIVVISARDAGNLIGPSVLATFDVQNEE